MFSAQIPAVNQFSQSPGGPLVAVSGAINALEASSLANHLASLKNQQQQYQNQITAPYAQMANPFAKAALSQAQAKPNLTQAQANQANANAGYLGSERDINRYKLKQGGAYISPEGYLYSTPIGGSSGTGATGIAGGGITSSPGSSVNEHGVIMPSDSGGDMSGNSPSSSSPSVANTPNVSGVQSSIAQPPTNAINSNLVLPSAASGNSLTTAPTILNSANKQPQTMGQMIMQGRIAQAQAAQARAQTDIMEKNAFSYKLMTPDAKSQLDSIFNGAGIDQLEARQDLAAGKTPNQILAERGINPKDVTPVPLATDADRKIINQKKAAIAAINTLGPIVQKGLAPYIQTIHGRSPAQIADAISGDDKEKQISFLEAYGISPDLAAMRGQAINLHMGKGILNELTDKMLANIEPFQALVDPDVYAEAQKRIDKDITSAGNNSIDAIVNAGKNVTTSKNNDPFNLRKYVK